MRSCFIITSQPFHSLPFHSIPFRSVPFLAVPFISFHSVDLLVLVLVLFPSLSFLFFFKADAKLQSIFSTAELRMEKPQWLVLLKGHPSLTDEEVTRLKQLRRRSKCCVYAGGTREKQQAKQKMVRKEQAQLATDNASLRSEVAALQHRCQALEALVAKLAKVPPLA